MTRRNLVELARQVMPWKFHGQADVPAEPQSPSSDGRDEAIETAIAPDSETKTETQIEVPAEPRTIIKKGNFDMSLIAETAEIHGFIGACLVDTESGMMLDAVGGGKGKLDLEAAAAMNTTFIRAKREAMEVLQLDTNIEDILITLGTQIHLIRPLERDQSKFIYVALDRKNANLGMARLQLKRIEEKVAV